MSVAIIIASLAALDIMMCGFRAAAGRDGRIDKRGYYRAAYARAAAFAVGVIALCSFVAWLLVETAPDPELAWHRLVHAGTFAAVVFGGFAAVTLAALALWLAPIPEVRVLATVTVLGPLTLVRSLVIGGGLIGASIVSPHPRVWVMAGVGAIAILAAEPVLGFLIARSISRRRGLLGPQTPS